MKAFATAALAALLGLSLAPTATAQTIGDLSGLLGQSRRPPIARGPQSQSLPNSERAILSAAQMNFDPSQNLLPYKNCRIQEEFVSALRRGVDREMIDPVDSHYTSYFGVPLSKWTVQHVVEADAFMASCQGQGQVRAGFFARELWPALVAARPAVTARTDAAEAEAQAYAARTSRITISPAAERSLTATVDPTGIQNCLVAGFATRLGDTGTAEISSIEKVDVRTRDRFGDVHTRSSYRATGVITMNGSSQRDYSTECAPLPGVGWAISG